MPDVAVSRQIGELLQPAKTGSFAMIYQPGGMPTGQGGKGPTP